jgi:TetR/AcrR family transcriptional regulator, mexJK operon transcriptional repressor
LTKTVIAKAGRPKSMQKRKQILLAAGDLFLSHGFSGCSMDMVAKHSGVSKQTVYSHFANKEALFIAVIVAKCEEYQLDEKHLEHDSGGLEVVLKQIGLQIIRLLHDKDVIAIYRVVIGEISTNPRVAELFYSAGPQQSLVMLAHCFQRSTVHELSDAQANQCAVMFFNLLKGEFHTKSILGLDYALSNQQQNEQVEFAVRQVCWFLDTH